MTYVWRPSREYVENSNVARLMRRMNVDTVDELRVRSVADVGVFWETVVDDLAIPFRKRWSSVLDLTDGIARPRWFVDGQINAFDACLGVWSEREPDALAVVHETEGGTVDQLTYRELADKVARLRGSLRAQGVGKGDAVAIYLPMITEAVIATYAIASVGAIVVPLFSGFAAPAISSRLQDAEAVAVITADATVRRGKQATMLPALRTAIESCPSVRLVVVVENVGQSVELRASEIGWEAAVSGEPDHDVEATSADDVLLLAYTSGTTGRPKGAVHTHAGFVTKTACEVAYGFEMGPGRTFCWITDMGWIMGPLSIFGTHGTGGTLLLYEGSPDVPGLARLWDLVECYGVSMLGVSPTLIRTLKASGGHAARDLSCIRTIGSTGEPWDPASYGWLARDVLNSRVPIINFSGGTEVGGSFLCPYPVEEIPSCSLGGPALGMDVDVVNDHAEPVEGEIGELVCRQPWPSMTRGLWRDDDGSRYHEAYWSTFDGLWRHGDYALRDAEGSWFILGRSDDVMNVAGKRVAPAEIESVLTGHTAIAEVAAVGVPDVLKGEAVWVFYTVAQEGNASGDQDDSVAADVRSLVAEGVGKPFSPSRVIRVRHLPKTRSAKIMRRAIRAAALDIDAGDLSGAENPEAVDEIRELLASQSS